MGTTLNGTHSWLVRIPQLGMRKRGQAQHYQKGPQLTAIMGPPGPGAEVVNHKLVGAGYLPMCLLTVLETPLLGGKSG